MSKQKANKGMKKADVGEAEAPAERPEKMSKADAVRKVLVVGKELPIEAVAFVKAEFDLEMPPAIFSTYKATEKKKAGGGAGPKKAKQANPTASGSATWTPLNS